MIQNVQNITHTVHLLQMVFINSHSDDFMEYITHNMTYYNLTWSNKQQMNLCD
jgi:hypothetical protein